MSEHDTDLVTETESTAVIELPGSFDDYLAGIGKKQRHELRRKRRRYEENRHRDRSLDAARHGTARGAVLPGRLRSARSLVAA